MSISPLLSSGLTGFGSQPFGFPGNPPGNFDSIFASLISPSFLESTDSSSGLLNLLVQGSGTRSAGLSAGRNMSLADPESAYKMMTLINSKDVLYKAQYSELNRMGSGVEEMEAAGRSLAGITAADGNDGIKAALQNFAERYSARIRHFRSDLQDGGLLDGMQAAEISQYELEQSVNYRFYGVEEGLNGLGDLGITVDPATQTLSLDTAKLDSLLASNLQGAVSALQEFGANFARTADLLNSANNFIPNQLDNLKRAIRFIDDNRDSLRAGFGTGDAAKPVGQVAQALAAYNSTYGV